MENLVEKQPNRLGKKAVSLIVAGALLVGGAVGLNSCGKQKQQVKDTEIIMEDEFSELELTDDFDINNDAQVTLRANDIYDMLTEAKDKVNVEDIKNMIYYYNGAYDKMSIKGSDAEKATYIYDLAMNYFEVLTDNIYDDANAMALVLAGSSDAEVKDDSEIYAYQFIASGKSDKNSSKYVSLKFSKLVNDTLESIKNNDKKTIEENAKKFYEMSKTIKDYDFSDNEMASLLLDLRAKEFMAEALTKEQKQEIVKDDYNVYVQAHADEAIKTLEISIEELLDEARENGGCGNTLTQLGDRYVPSDAQDANNRVNTGSKVESTTVVNQGGQHIGTTTVTPSNPASETTTKVEVESHTVAGVVESEEEIIIEEGGELISEGYEANDALDAEQFANYVDADTLSTTLVLSK